MPFNIMNKELNSACRSKTGYEEVKRLLNEEEVDPTLDNFSAVVSAYHYERLDILSLLMSNELIKSKLHEYKVGYRYYKDDPTIEQISLKLTQNTIANF